MWPSNNELLIRIAARVLGIRNTVVFFLKNWATGNEFKLERIDLGSKEYHIFFLRFGYVENNWGKFIGYIGKMCSCIRYITSPLIHPV